MISRVLTGTGQLLINAGTIEGNNTLNPLIAANQLPVDPTVDCPKGYEESQRNQPGGFSGEADIFAEDITMRGFNHAAMRLLLNAITLGPSL